MMRCPKCLTKTSDLIDHMRKKHQDCMSTSESDADSEQEFDIMPWTPLSSKTRHKHGTSSKKGKAPLKKVRLQKIEQISAKDSKQKDTVVPDKNTPALKRTIVQKDEPIVRKRLSSVGAEHKDHTVHNPAPSTVSCSVKGKSPLKTTKMVRTTKKTVMTKIPLKKDPTTPFRVHPNKKESNSPLKKKHKDVMKNADKKDSRMKPSNVTTDKEGQTRKRLQKEDTEQYVRYMRKRRTGTKVKRLRRPCPYCPVLVIHMARHLRQMHNMDEHQARLAVRRNRDIIKGHSPGTVRKYRECPVSHCLAKVKYLSKHLSNVHKYGSERARSISINIRYGQHISITDSSDSEEKVSESIEQKPSSEESNHSELDDNNARVTVLDLSTGKEIEGFQITEHKSQNTKADVVPTTPDTNIESDKQPNETINFFETIKLIPLGKAKLKEPTSAIDNVPNPKQGTDDKTGNSMTSHETLLYETCDRGNTFGVTRPKTSPMQDIVSPTNRKNITIKAIVHASENSESAPVNVVAAEVYQSEAKKTSRETEISQNTITTEKCDTSPSIITIKTNLNEGENTESNPGNIFTHEVVLPELPSEQITAEVEVEEKVGEKTVNTYWVPAEVIVKPGMSDQPLLYQQNSSKRFKSTPSPNEKEKDGQNINLVTAEIEIKPGTSKQLPSSQNKIKRKLKIPILTKRKKKITNWRAVSTLKEFNTYLRSAQRNVSIKNAEQKCSQLLQIWNSVDGSGLFYFGPITDPQRIANNWLEKITKTKNPGTVQSYLATLSDFWKYQNMLKRLKAARLTELLSWRESWLKSMRQKAKKRRVQVKIKQSRERLTKEDIKQFIDSDIRQKVMADLDEIKSKPVKEKKWCLSLEKWNRIIGYIALQLALDNAQRCGAILGITMNEFANKHKIDDRVVCTVEHHKTGFLEPCHLVMTKDLSSIMDRYLQARRLLAIGLPRKIFILRPDAQLLLQWSGKEIDTSLMNKLIKRVWKEAGCKGDISFTKIRKATVTQFREDRPQSRIELARHMTHRPSTADSYYSLGQELTAAVKVSKEIQKVMTSCEQKNPKLESDEKKTDVDDMSQIMASCDDIQPETDIASLDQDIQPEPDKSSHDHRSETSSHKRRCFTTKDQEIIKENCIDLITSDEGIEQQDVLFKINETEEGRELVDRMVRDFGNKTAIKKIADRVRTFRKTYKKYQPKN